jgi:hypothetical protein
MAISKVTTASITDADITTAKLAYDAAPFRNIIINGDMSIAQRGTSVSGITTTAYNTLDRWRFNINNFSMGTWTMSQETDAPSGQGFANSLKLDCTVADASPSASDFLTIEQRFEGQMLQYLKKGTANAVSLTLSFWVKSNKTGTYIAEIIDTNNDRNNVNSYTIDTADTWEKKTITISGDTTGILNNDNGVSLRASFWLGAGSDYTSGTLQSGWATRNNANRAVGVTNLADSTANEWYITGVQLEAGTSASDFEFLPQDINLQRCLRYCLKLGTIDGSSFEKFGIGSNANTTTIFGITPFPVPMRTQPSLTVTSTASDYGVYHLGDIVCSSVPTLNTNSTDKVGAVTFTVASGLTSGGASILQENSNSGAYLIWSAEI